MLDPMDEFSDDSPAPEKLESAVEVDAQEVTSVETPVESEPQVPEQTEETKQTSEPEAPE